MVAVVGNLVEEGGAVGIHFHKPFKPPACLIEDVGHTVAALVAGGVVVVAPHFWSTEIGKHHFVGGIGRGGYILQIVARIVPASYHIDFLTATGGVKHYYAVVGVATVFEKRIIATAVLAHVIKWYFLAVGIHIVADAKLARLYIAHFYNIGAGGGDFGEIEPCSCLERTACSDVFHGFELHAAPSVGVYHFKCLHGMLFKHHHHSHFLVVGEITHLVYSYPRLRGSDKARQREGKKQE